MSKLAGELEKVRIFADAVMAQASGDPAGPRGPDCGSPPTGPSSGEGWETVAEFRFAARETCREEGRKKMRACVMEKLPKHHDFRAARLEAASPKVAFKPFRMCGYCHAHLETRHYVGEMIILECPKAPEGFHPITPIAFGGRLPS